MRIGLVTLDYPPDASEGVARQRHMLAQALTARGHDVHVITRGPRIAHAIESGVHVHRYHCDRVHKFLRDLPVLDSALTDAELLCEGVLDVHQRTPLDVVDVPLWLAQPLALVRAAPCPVVVWLQTTVLQLVELQARAPRRHEQVLAEIDRRNLGAAAACLADSSSIVSEIARLYALPSLVDACTVVHPGVPDQPVERTRRDDGSVEALVVGRLEGRKGTARLFEQLPALLARVPALRVRFVGRDNSGADGYRRATGHGYPEAFAAAHPALTTRVRFDGYVDDAALASHYASADLLLHPAHYESFGLVFTEAMRAALPVVAFAAGGAREVFAHGEADGGVLVAPGRFDRLADAVAELAGDPSRRRALGDAGQRAFRERFSSARMARDTAAVYARVIAAQPGAPRRPGRVFQVMEALQDRDAVSRIARTNAATLAGCGAERPILSLFADAAVTAETGRLRGARFRPSDGALVHYWGFSRLERLIARFPGRLAVHYHNITPPRFFGPRSPHYEMTLRGYAQLERIANAFDLIVGDSIFNVREYARYLTTPRPSLCIYPVVDAAALKMAPWDRGLARALRADAEPRWLFVGRFAPNKRHDRVMQAFDRFVTRTGRGRLALVGDMTAVPAYTDELRELRGRLDHGDRIAFVPSVPDDALRAWYRTADLFVCASEHEGFCLPVAEAMAFDVPVLALDRGAVGETVRDAGVLVPDWDPDQVAEIAADLLESSGRRAAVAGRMTRRLLDFSPSAIQPRLRAVAAFLRDGVTSPLFVPAAPAVPPLAALETDTTWAPSTI